MVRRSSRFITRKCHGFVLEKRPLLWFESGVMSTRISVTLAMPRAFDAASTSSAIPAADNNIGVGMALLSPALDHRLSAAGPGTVLHDVLPVGFIAAYPFDLAPIFYIHGLRSRASKQISCAQNRDTNS